MTATSKTTKKPAKKAATRAATAKAPAKKAATATRGGKAAKPDLLAVRAQIDGIDREIQSLIAERALFAHQVG
jgi:chorismate mutase/prephenate dehydratase